MANDNMKLSLIRQLWGIEKPWKNAFAAFERFGYDGVEIALPFLDPEEEYKELLAKHSLAIIPMIFTTGTTVAEYVQSFRDQLIAAQRFNPNIVTCHDGKDAFSDVDATAYYSEVLKIEKDLGANVGHETHRGRILYNPWTTARVIDQFENLKLCVDFSHWVCVCERIIHDQEDIIGACADRAIHIHGRVGYGEGPQVPDPRIELYSAELEAHEKWWDMVWNAQESRGMKRSTFTPEFGPPPYMQTHPLSEEPASVLWDICDWMATRQRDRFADRRTSS